MNETEDVPVLIVGAGPVGLSMALLLGRFGIRSVIVERRRALSPHPRARFVNARTMEILRQLGLEEAARKVAIPDGVATCVLWTPVLVAPEVKRVEIESLGPATGEPLSPSPGITTSQDRLDPILRQAVVARGRTDIRSGWRLVELAQDGQSVSAACTDEATGETRTIRASYLVAADGANSTVRELLQIEREGPAFLGHSINIHFRADLRAALRGRPVNMAMILNPAQSGLLLNIDGAQRWTAQAIYSPAAGHRVEDFTPDRCSSIVRTQVGVPDLPVEVIGVAPWASAAQVATRFSVGRVFLAGDSAQEMPPAGGFGMNTGIQEAHNLAWKLAAVLNGWAGPSLLETYDTERRPIGQWVTRQALLNLTSVGRIESPDGSPTQVKLGRPEFFRELGLVFGATYPEGAVIADGGASAAESGSVVDYRPAASPGSRAPHCWMEVDGERVSTLDLWGDGFTVLASVSATAWRAEIETVAKSSRSPLRTLSCADESVAELYGLGKGGAVLVRPDGYVAWRSANSPAAMPVAEALRSVVRSAQ